MFILKLTFTILPYFFQNTYMIIYFKLYIIKTSIFFFNYFFLSFFRTQQPRPVVNKKFSIENQTIKKSVPQI